MNLLAPETWETLESSLNDLITHPDPKLLPFSFHASLYAIIYDYMTSSRPMPGHINVPGLAALGLAPNPHIPAAAYLYCTISNKLESHLTDILRDASGFHGEMLLEYYSTQWKKYLVMARTLDHDCAYLTRHWVKIVMAKRDDIHTVEALAVIKWKMVLVDGLQLSDQRLTRALLDVVSSHRAGSAANLGLLTSVLASLATLGRSGQHGESFTPDVYQDIFENIFLHESTERYRREATYLALGGARGYLPGVRNWLDIEEKFATVLPTKDSYAKFQTTLRDILVVGHSQTIEAYMVDSVNQRYHQGLKELYSFHLRLGALDRLRETFLRLFSRAVTPALSEERDSTLPDAQSQSILSVYSKIVVEDFEKDEVILEALDRDTATVTSARAALPQGHDDRI